jgi:cyclase
MDMKTGPELFQLKLVTEGVYIALAASQYYVNCNAAVIVLDDSLLVVDAHSSPTAAQALIDQIRQLTDKPVKYLVITHPHWDHYWGIQAYLNAWPSGVEIISSRLTRASIEQRGALQIKDTLLQASTEAAQLKSELEAVADPAARPALIESLRQCEEYLAELGKIRIVLPTLTFDQSLVIHRPRRTVEIRWLGRGHTEGDVVVYLPYDRVLVTGDLVHGWLPWVGDAYLHDWIRLLEAIEKLDFEYVIGGHGDVIHGKRLFDVWKHYLQDLLDLAAEASAGGASLPQVQERVIPRLKSKYAEEFDPEMLALSVAEQVEQVYRVVGEGTAS